MRLSFSSLVALLLAGTLFASGPSATMSVPLPSKKADKGIPTPLTLDEALDYAMGHNPQIKIAKEQLRAQKGILVQSVAAAGPQVTANASGTDYKSSALMNGGMGTEAGRKNWDANFTLRQSVFAGGGIISNINASRENMLAAKSSLTSTIELTVYNLKQAFYSVIVDRQIIGVHQENLQVLGEQLKNVEAKRRAGVSSDFEVLQATVAVENEKPLLIRAQNDYRVAVENLLNVLGAPPAVDLEPSDVQGELAIEKIDPRLSELIADAETYRPDIAAARHSTHAAQSQEWTAIASGLPTVNFFASYDWLKDESVSRTTANVNGWEMGVVASATLWDNFATAGRVFYARSARRAAEATALQTRLQATLDVREAYSSFDESRQILQSAEKVVEQARESLRLSRARFAAGSGTQLDILQAESALSQARLTLLQSQYDYVVAVAKMEQSTGTHQWKIVLKE
jgi:outer membrane protein TolC